MTKYTFQDIFQWLNPEARLAFIKIAQTRKYLKRQIVFANGDDGNEFYRIASGKVRIYEITADERELTYGLLEAGDCFGFVSLLDNGPRHATVETCSKVELQVITQSAFEKLSAKHPIFLDGLLQLCAIHIRGMADRLASAHFDNVPARLLRCILREVDFSEPDSVDGTGLSVRFSQSELALMIGASRQSVNKALQAFHCQGLLSVCGGRLTIQNLKKMRALSAER